MILNQECLGALSAGSFPLDTRYDACLRVAAAPRPLMYWPNIPVDLRPYQTSRGQRYCLVSGFRLHDELYFQVTPMAKDQRSKSSINVSARRLRTLRRRKRSLSCLRTPRKLALRAFRCPLILDCACLAKWNNVIARGSLGIFLGKLYYITLRCVRWRPTLSCCLFDSE